MTELHRSQGLSLRGRSMGHPSGMQVRGRTPRLRIRGTPAYVLRGCPVCRGDLLREPSRPRDDYLCLLCGRSYGSGGADALPPRERR
jgi:hypothetical protein